MDSLATRSAQMHRIQAFCSGVRLELVHRRLSAAAVRSRRLKFRVGLARALGFEWAGGAEPLLLWRFQVLAIGVLLLVDAGAVWAQGRAGDIAGKQRVDSDNWLQLRQEQGDYRRAAEPLSASDQRTLDQQLQRQRQQQRDLQLRQDQAAQSARQQRRTSPSLRPDPPFGPSVDAQRQQQQQRQQMRIQRDTWPYPRP